jgi:uncharacterized cupin superfamily protein
MIQKINLAQLPHRELQSEASGVMYSLSATLPSDFCPTGTTLRHEILPPGRSSSKAHYHSHLREMVLILEGEATLRQGGKQSNLSVGDLVVFPPGKEHVHQVSNCTDNPVRMLVMVSESEEDEVTYVE